MCWCSRSLGLCFDSCIAAIEEIVEIVITLSGCSTELVSKCMRATLPRSGVSGVSGLSGVRMPIMLTHTPSSKWHLQTAHAKCRVPANHNPDSYNTRSITWHYLRMYSYVCLATSSWWQCECMCMSKWILLREWTNVWMSEWMPGRMSEMPKSGNLRISVLFSYRWTCLVRKCAKIHSKWLAPMHAGCCQYGRLWASVCACTLQHRRHVGWPTPCKRDQRSEANKQTNTNC